MSTSLPIKYYTMMYGDDTSAAFIHLVREIGQIAFATEAKNSPVLEAKQTEAAVLLQFIAHSRKMDLESNTEMMYSKKLSVRENMNNNSTRCRVISYTSFLAHRPSILS